jgi:hypothetical protein
MDPVLEVGAEYTVTAKTMEIKSRTEILVADIIKIDLLVILNYITSFVRGIYSRFHFSYVIDLMGC